MQTWKVSMTKRRVNIAAIDEEPEEFEQHLNF